MRSINQFVIRNRGVCIDNINRNLYIGSKYIHERDIYGIG